METHTSFENLQAILNQLKGRFPDEVVKKRIGPNKKVDGKWVQQYFDYIPTDHLHERLDAVLSLNWSWEIVDKLRISFIKAVKVKKDDENGRYHFEEEEKEVEQVIVCGKLTIVLPDGRTVVREALGGCDITYGSQAGDSYKIADSNAFKKACYKFGIGRYLGIEGAEEDQHEKTPLTKSSNPFSTKQAKPQVENKGKKNPFTK
jgi:hypothetical protein